MNKPSTQGADLAAALDAIAKLTDRVDRLSIGVEELTVELEWRNNNSTEAQHSPTRFVLTSMPLDPATTDWEINRIRPTDIEGSPVPTRNSQQALFD